MPEDSLVFIGLVRSALAAPGEAPKQGFEGGVQAVVEMEPECVAGLSGLRAGQDVLLFTWLHQARRDVLASHPRGDASKPKSGVFSLRSPHRPNPIGLHRVRVMAVDGPRLTVAPLEAIDGTPVIDIKPVLDAEARPAMPDAPPTASPSIRQEADADMALLMEAGERAWTRGLISGFNGNLSLRSGQDMLVTASGCAKGRLSPADIVRVRIADGSVLSGGPCSSETPMHLAVYRAVPEARAIVHLHPRELLALSLVVSEDQLLALPLYEAAVYRREMTCVPVLNPGSEELAQSVAQVLAERKAAFLHGHGLTCRGPDLFAALHLAEELEALASIQLRTLR